MFDDPRPQMQRTRGQALVAMSRRGGVTRLDRLAQSGSAKAFLPRVHTDVPEIVFLNTAGGLTGGDKLSFGVNVGDGARVVAATQTAERVYRAAEGVAEVDVCLTVGKGAELHWLPQETIAFEGAALARETTVDLDRDARFLMVETLVLGRAAMGERVNTLSLTDRRTVRREGRPVFVEPLAIDTAALAVRSPATLGDAQALTTLAFIAPGAEDALGPVRAALEGSPVNAAASAWDGKLTLRAMSPDAHGLRRLVAHVLTQLRGGPLPRVWQV
ncbi:MAG: urease accessory protein UreD [Rhodobacteraceae bacterium]|nr:urease accessory protein UreD [Paracoccaceae bacterium]